MEVKADQGFKSWHAGLPGNDTGEDDLVEMSTPFEYTPASGKTIGKHNGAHFFTIGQRKGINIGGYNEPLFVIATDVEMNILYVGEGQSHPGLLRKGLFICREDVHLVRPDLETEAG